MVLDQVNQNRQIIKNVPVLTYILEKNRQVMYEEDYPLLDDLAHYLEQLKEEFGENVDFSHYSLDNPDEVEAAFYELLHAHYQDEYKLLRDWQYLLGAKIFRPYLCTGLMLSVSLLPSVCPRS